MTKTLMALIPPVPGHAIALTMISGDFDAR